MKRILIPVDFSAVTLPMRQAVEPLAKAFDSKVYFLHAIPARNFHDSTLGNGSIE